MKKPKILIFGDKRREKVFETIQSFERFVKGKAKVLANCYQGDCLNNLLQEADYAFVFGGDGTILSAARDLSENNVPVIGINVGKLGFLAEFSLNQVKKHFKRLTTDKSLIEKRMVLKCTITRNKKEKIVSTAINEVVITAGPKFNMIDLKMMVQGQSLADCIGDGIIISTPTGSTAYNLSAGGPILSARLSAIVITPLCPHTLSFRPIVIDAEKKIAIYPQRLNEGTTIILDGEILCSLQIDDVITIEKHNGSFLVVNNPFQTQWDTLAGKLNWAQKPKYRISERAKK
ncbi:MAG: hypothetical protein A2Y12_12245 [Planctomycetes bacterium GWF2_42_9]|nr:MAG: hypothetical protein A2Y12_12245 [Planctomycetes bacterium GWF2_42_9]HAL44967.1 hypothetical protein [Phycisphaerales bacterium]